MGASMEGRISTIGYCLSLRHKAGFLGISDSDSVRVNIALTGLDFALH